MTAYMNLNAAMPFCRHVDAGVQFCSLYYGIDADGLNRFCDENQLRESIRNCMLNHFSEDLVYARCEPGSRNPDCVREVTRAADPASGTQWDEGFNCIARAYRDIYDYPSAAVLAPYGGELDADGDGTCAFIDNCNNRGGDNGDPDQDGVPTACDNCPERMNAPPDGQRFQADADGDGVGDQCEEIHAEIHMGAPSRSLAVIKEQGGLYYDLRVPEAEQSPVTVDCDYTVQRIEQNGDLISSHTHQGCGSPYLGFWNGRDAAGAYVQPGRYVLRVEYYRYRSPNEPVVDATVVVPFLIYDLRVSPVGASNADLVANEPVQVFLDGDDDNQNGVIDSAEDLSFQEDDTVGLTYVALPADLAATLSIRRVDGGDARLWNPATRARVNLPNDAPPANLALEGTGVGDVVLTVRAVDGGQVLESEQRFRVVPPGANLQADSNRDGTVNDEDDAQEEVWNASAGAIFLPNLDVDANQCPRDAVLPESLVACSDASDEIVNLDADLADLARFNLAPWNDVPPDAEGRLQISPANAPVRLFQGTHAPYAHAADWTVMRPDVSRLSASDLRAGVAFAIEGTDIARDLEAWDGEITIELIVTRDPPPHVQRSQIFRDRVRMRVAPLVTQHTLDPVSVVFAREPNPTDGFRSQSLVTDMAAALDEAGLGGDATLQLIRDGDQWIQDHFEFAYASLPTVDEGQHIVFFAMTTATRLAKDEGGAEVYQHLRGVDVAGVMVGWTRKARSYDFMGNFETIPPYAQGGRRYPLGRALMGWSESLQQGWDVETRKLQAAQRVQPAVYLDSTWLEVGHVDETLQFIPTQVLNPCVPGARQDNCRGWVVLVQDPLLAIAMLHQAAARGAGDTALVSPNGEQLESKWGLIPGVTTIQAALNNEILMADSLEAARYIQDEVDVLRRETGIGDADIVPAPALYLRLEQGYLAFQAATTNGVMLTPMVYAAPDPHGPIVDGEDLYKVQLEAALAPFGVQVEWVEDWNNYHNANGEVHCGSNVLREVNLNEHWWEVTP